MLIENLSAQELQMITNYRHNYAYSSDAHTMNGTFMDTPFILREWDHQKSQFLYKLLGEKLMVSKHLNYEKSYEELQEEISSFTSRRFGRVGRSGELFCREYFELVYPNASSVAKIQLPENVKDGLNRLISDDCLISNRYDGESFEVETANGKPFRVNSGCKASKALGKIASIFNLHGYEDFRICHSQVLNQKMLGGELTLSIHPLDYMTMSDNECDWESCMSWRNEGGYRQGTVEMMNSPCVIVAYLSAEEPMRMWGINGRHDDSNDTWNNKKWRQLFFVNRNIIISVKDYPYHNSDLTKMVIEQIRILAKENCGWTYSDPMKYDCNNEKLFASYLPEDKNYFMLDVQHGAMYNDFGCLDFHWACLGDDIDPEEIHVHSWNGNKPFMTLPYGGKSECMICGELNPDTEDESCLACYDCQDRLRCDCCGEICDSIETIDGMNLCPYCYENRVRECEVCHEWHYDEFVQPIYVIPRLSATEQKALVERFKKEHPFSWQHEQLTGNEDWNYYQSDSEIWVCSEDETCFNLWCENNLREGCKPHQREMRWNISWYIYYDELTPQAQEKYAYGFDGDPEAYKEIFWFNQAYPSRIIPEN